MRSRHSVVGRGGLAAALMVGALAGAHALRRAGQWALHANRPDEYRDENFALFDSDTVSTVRTADGVRLAVRTHGHEDAAATVVFVHGFCNTMESFHFQRRDLPQRWGPDVRLVFFDQRGHGRSGTPPKGSCTVGRLGRDLGTVIEKVAPTGPVVLVGHSLGGMTVLAAASRFPELFATRISAVALISTTAAEVTSMGVTQLLRNPAVDGFRLLAHLAPALVQAGRTTARHVITPLLHVTSFHGPVSPALSRFTTRMIDRTPIDTIVQFLDSLRVHDESAALPALATTPVLVLGGSNDLVIPFGHSRLLAEALPVSELVRVRDAAHMPHLQHPDQVNDALDGLLVRAGIFDEDMRLRLGG
ncbi:alpha/beta fold hydrolase [Nocardia higoensis]|uniref:alpha/beta fold hydrolase n=1 Tax=Nocardia higoensis TaxID=228599 RepID=UPI0005952227|nr:alpha/beta hydrolase [Nocardia higoensis]